MRLLALVPLLLAGCTGMTPEKAPEPSGILEPAATGVSGVAPPGLTPSVEVRVPDRDLWARLRAGYQLGIPAHPRVVREAQRYTRDPRFLANVIERGRTWFPYIVREAESRGLPTELALLPIVESGMDPWAYSPGRASGLWQFIGSTGRLYDLHADWWHDQRRDPIAATHAAMKHLADLHGMFGGDWLLALAAYNAGPGAVRRAVRRNLAAGGRGDFFELDLPAETRTYVPRLLAISQVFARPADWNITLPSMSDEPGFEVVDTKGQIDLARAAQIAGVSIEALYRLNPSLNRWATHPHGPHRLLVAPDHADALRAGIDAIEDSERVTWSRHEIRPGESLARIARQHDLSVRTLQQINHLQGSLIRAGDHLLVPSPGADLGRYVHDSEGRQRLRDTHNGDGRERHVHVVQAGESFWSIARQWNLPMARLARWNGRVLADPLLEGDELVIWASESSGGARGDAFAGPAGRTEPVTRRVGYAVRTGDSLWRISDRFGVALADILQWNQLDASRPLQPGQRLTLFVNVTGE